MKFENTQIWGFEHALRGMRNPKESWSKSDSGYCMDRDFDCEDCPTNENCPMGTEWKYSPDAYVIGANDMKLAQTLIRGGSEHRKFLRQIFVSVDITAPLYWWKEFDTYKVGTVANSTSTMHKMASKPITLDCFEIDDYKPELQLIDPTSIDVRVNCFIDDLEQLRQLHLQYLEESKRKDITDEERRDFQKMAKMYWKELIRWLPESWLQTRTVTMNYENLLNMCSKGQRRFHKLTEWSDSFISWARTLPYAQEFIFIDELENKNGETK